MYESEQKIVVSCSDSWGFTALMSFSRTLLVGMPLQSKCLRYDAEMVKNQVQSYDHAKTVRLNHWVVSQANGTNMDLVWCMRLASLTGFMPLP